MARKRRHEEHINHEAWAIPYGDLVTLLLAFFVVMYAMSSVNEGKYRILSDSLVAAFRAPPKSMEPIQVGEAARSLYQLQAQHARTLVPLEVESRQVDWLEDSTVPEGFEYFRGAGMTEENLEAAERMIEELTAAIAEQLAELVEQDLVRLRRDRYWLEIEINTSVLFDSASAELAAESVPVLRRLSEILAGKQTRVQVEGHTDLRPINTPIFPSNWELSAARAASVVRLFESGGVAPEHMAALGFGEHRPIAPNDTEAGQSRNRRVIIVVMARSDELAREALAGADEAQRGHAATDAVAGLTRAEVARQP